MAFVQIRRGLMQLKLEVRGHPGMAELLQKTQMRNFGTLCTRVHIL